MIMLRVLIFLFVLMTFPLHSQPLKTRNIIIITLDGFRWQELYRGLDRDITDQTLNSDMLIKARFDGDDIFERRQKLLPFFWTTIATKGQLYGNRDIGNRVNCANWHLLSYPGYNELLTGFVDHRVSNNDEGTNPHTTVLEFLNNQSAIKGRVAAFATWKVFSDILREQESGIPVNAGNDLAEGDLTIKERWMNDNQALITAPGGSRYDEFTFQYAFEYLKRERPRVLYIAFDETDTHAHGGRYGEYLKSAHHVDGLIRKLWDWLQQDPEYFEQTTLLITTDHGRGAGKRNWQHHRLLAPGSRHTWLAVLGPDTPAFGEIALPQKYSQKQVAGTLAAFMGFQYVNVRPVAKPVSTMLANPPSTTEVTTAQNTNAGKQ